VEDCNKETYITGITVFYWTFLETLFVPEQVYGTITVFGKVARFVNKK